MDQRDPLPRRSATEWGVRGVLALAAAILGYISVTQSLAYTIANQYPARAYTLLPWDGRITAALAEKLLLETQASSPQSEAARLAHLALRQDPTAVQAITTIGFQAALREDMRGAQRLFGYAQQVTRRDFDTQLWAIEDAVRRDDIPQALRHYDIALRTTSIAPDILFPVLTAAIGDPTIRSSLAETLKTRPAWTPHFIHFAASREGDPRSTSELFAALARAGIPISDEAQASLIERLIVGGSAVDAWRFYASLHRGVDRRMSRDPRFTADPGTPSLFDWVPTDEANMATSVQRGPEGGVLVFSVPPSASGVVVQQMQLLPPGPYRIEGSSSDIEQPDGSLPYWTLACRPGHELGRVIVPNSSQQNGAFAGQFSVPADCPVQTLALIARSSQNLSGVTGQITRIRLVPVR